MSFIHSLSHSTPETPLLNDEQVVTRVFQHIDNGTTDLGDTVWHEPVAHYHSQARFDAEIALLRSLPVPFCPSAALPDPGSYVARNAAGTPLLVVRGNDGVVRAFINACPASRHASRVGLRLRQGVCVSVSCLDLWP